MTDLEFFGLGIGELVVYEGELMQIRRFGTTGTITIAYLDDSMRLRTRHRCEIKIPYDL